MEKHFVIFFSPGTLFAETTERAIEAWDTEKAMAMAREIKERHGATPYGFCFTTRARKEDDLDSKESKRSGVHYLGGQVLTLEDVKAENDPKNATLISNMECNDYAKIVRNDNSWRWTQPLEPGDVVLDFKP